MKKKERDLDIIRSEMEEQKKIKDPETYFATFTPQICSKSREYASRKGRNRNMARSVTVTLKRKEGKL